MAATYTLQPVGADDLSELTELLHASKFDLSINRLIFVDWPDATVQRHMYSTAIKDSHESTTVEDIKAVDIATGEIVGFLALSRHTAKNSEHHDTTVDTTPDGIHPQLFATVTDAIARVEAKVSEFERYEITYMCVRKAYRGRGIGSLMLETCFERCKAHQLPLVLCSEPAAVDFFQKLEFQELEYADIDLSRFSVPYSGFGAFRLTEMMWSPFATQGGTSEKLQ